MDDKKSGCFTFLLGILLIWLFTSLDDVAKRVAKSNRRISTLEQDVIKLKNDIRNLDDR